MCLKTSKITSPFVPPPSIDNSLTPVPFKITKDQNFNDNIKQILNIYINLPLTGGA